MTSEHTDTRAATGEEEQQVNIVFSKLTSYLDTRLQIMKLKAVQKGASAGSVVMAKLILAALIFFFVMALNIGLGLWIGGLLGHTYLGFFVLAGFYGLCILIYLGIQEKSVKTPVENSIIRQMTKND